jgi:hypothetical protein
MMNKLSFIVLMLYSLNAFCMGDEREWLPHALEAYELKSLRVCAIVLDEGAPYIVIKDPHGYAHRAFLGDMMGKNYGVVRKIDKKEIILEELIKTKDGEWITQNVQLKYEKNEKECSIRMPTIKYEKNSAQSKQGQQRDATNKTRGAK